MLVIPSLNNSSRVFTMNLETLFPLSFSASMLEDMYGCPQLFFKKYCQRLVGSGRSVDLYAGGLMANALEIVRKAYYNDKLPESEAIELGCEFIGSSPETGDNLKSNVRLSQALERYFKTFPLSSGLAPCELADATYAIEYPFSLDLGLPHPEIPGTNLLFKGKLDFIGERSNFMGKLERFVVDDKTASRISRIPGSKEIDVDRERAQYMMRGQFKAYNFAAKMLGMGVVGTIVRKIPLTASSDAPFEIVVPCTEYELELWLYSVQNKIREFLERYKAFKKDRNFSPNYTFFPIDGSGTSCYTYARPCNFMVSCKNKDGEEIIQMSYRQGVRDSESGVEIPLIEYKQKVGAL